VIEDSPISEEVEVINLTVFVGHGGSRQWRDLKDHLHEQHGYEVIAYETGSRAGHSIRDVIESMLDKASVAILVMTGEDKQPDGTFCARQNVVHELGLFKVVWALQRR
jgi:predicted nucleotide-binding protein